VAAVMETVVMSHIQGVSRFTVEHQTAEEVPVFAGLQMQREQTGLIGVVPTHYCTTAGNKAAMNHSLEEAIFHLSYTRTVLGEGHFHQPGTLLSLIHI